MEVAAFFHVWTAGAWEEPEREFWQAVEASGFAGPVVMSYVAEGNESVTLNALREYASDHEGAVLYAHTKGASNPEPFRARWRRSMLARVVAPWRDNLALLEKRCDCDGGMVFGCCGRMVGLGDCCCAPEATTCSACHGTGYAVDAVGCHWLTEAEYPGMFGAMTVPADGSGFFGGNFWMARTCYLRTLPVCESEPRWQAEQWIGRGHPRVVDLLPGWPHDNRWPELCG